jgi:hypothetical protein
VSNTMTNTDGIERITVSFTHVGVEKDMREFS